MIRRLYDTVKPHLLRTPTKLYDSIKINTKQNFFIPHEINLTSSELFISIKKSIFFSLVNYVGN